MQEPPVGLKAKALEGSTIAYSWCKGTPAFCNRVFGGCTLHRSLVSDNNSRQAVYVRLVDPRVMADLPLRHLVGAKNREFID